MSFFGYDSFTDAIDGGGKGKSGDTYGNGDFSSADKNNDGHISAAEAEAVGGLKGGWDGDDDKGSFFGIDLGSGSDVDMTNINPQDRGEGGASDSSSSSSSSSDSEEEASTEQDTLTPEAILRYAQESGLIQSNADLEAMIADPGKFLADRGMNMSTLVNQMLLDPNTEGATIDGTKDVYNPERNTSYDPALINPEDVAGYNSPVNPGAAGYDAVTVGDTVLDPNYTANAITGEFKDGYAVDANGLVIDMKGAATGINADGTTNYTGQALNAYATQNIGTIIDTSTTSGKLLAQALGEGNYVDSKATILGQMELISKEFVDANGNPQIPSWAKSTYRSLARTVGFTGISGTAAMGEYANAIMEATLGIAKDEAKFFQTLTEKNLDNKQQAFINKATALASFDETNVDVRTRAAISNARNFLDLDLTNLGAENEAMILNIGTRVDALFEDIKAKNAASRFLAEEENDLAQFYDGLAARAAEHYADAVNDARRFNAGEINDATEFKISADQRYDEFAANMQFKIDTNVADWRQKVATTNTQLLYDAAADDIANTLDISTEAMSQLWDRTDSLLDYMFKGAQTMEELDVRLLIAELQAASGKKSGGLFSAIIGGIAKVAAASVTAGSDARMKENIRHYETLNGINYYTWDWKDEAKAIGWDQYPTFGVIAQEVQKTHPDAVVEGPHGYLMVNYGKLKNEV